ncbi:outer membrane beta-barrel protein [Vibrio parahaemolyticus]|uniref:outer membrane beta-barrel protein n=1 Tax=Vibrio parahaemolyticus TaxID=670 RepID=UPI00111E1663|nr:outer membrane beta-barrel protein [Vibrio parahaemolyticus]EJF7264693.1 porin family protein [Vibrio parahaemolyticus]MDG2644829.1 outer membrane beta-barrel protein [Vibrio parahaemolyticus]TOH59377.1 wbfE protein [Vibrio parahaemolyticus]TOO36171.1 wbfE protein [Vibrio parahaemolyticus]TOO41114.1 wbfE protein [Vibrio parahaemolyticus]
MIGKQHCLGILSALGLSLSSFSASADFYAGALVSYSNAELKSSLSESVNEGSPFLLSAQIGYFFNDYIGLEGRYGTSIQRQSGLAIDGAASGFIKMNMPVSERIALYGLAGYSSVKVDLQNVDSDKAQGFSFGLGMHYALSNQNAIVFEFVDNVSEEPVRLNTITLGFQHRF